MAVGKKGTRRVCPNGHTYYKSSECPVCPRCEKARVKANAFLTGLAAPARRALETAGISTMRRLSAWTKSDLLKLHGLGPSAIPVLEKNLRSKGLSLKPEGKARPLPGKTVCKSSPKKCTAAYFITRLKALQSEEELRKIQRYFKTGEGEYGHNDEFIGVRMGELFALSKEMAGMPLPELEKLLESPIHEIRAGALSIMDKESRGKKIPAARLKAFFDLYIRRHDRVNNWDLVDLGCLNMTGRYLFSTSRAILYRLARSKNLWERRSAILSTCYFIRQGEVDDTFAIAVHLRNDPDDLVHKATGWMLRFAGSKDPVKLVSFLDSYAATLPRTLLRYAIENLDGKKKAYYLAFKKSAKTTKQ